MATGDGGPARPISDPLRLAVTAAVAGGLSTYALATAAGFDVGTLGRFARGECGLRLAAVDKLFAALGLGMTRGPNEAPQIPSDALRSAIAAGPLSVFAIEKASGVAHTAITKFARLEAGLEAVSADRLAAALGLYAIQGPKPEAGSPEWDQRRPISEAMLAEIEARGLDASGLARGTGLRKEQVERLLGPRGGAKLATVDRICEYLGLGFAVGPGAPPAVPSVAILAAIEAKGLSGRKAAKLSGVVFQAIDGFKAGRAGLELVSADRLAAALGLVAARGPVARPADRPPPDDLSIPYVDGLRAATKASGLSVYALSRISGLSQPTIARFLKGGGNLTTASIAKLASAVGFDPRPAGPPPVAARRCPVELREGSPPVVLGEHFPIQLTASEHAILETFVAGFAESRGFSVEQLGKLSEVDAPHKALSRMLKKAGYGPIASTLRRSGKKPVIWTMIDPRDRE